MRVQYIPVGEKVWLANMLQSGRGMGAFRGERFQRGYGLGSIFGSLLRTILPVVKTVGRAVGRQALRTGAQVATDVLQGQNFGTSLKVRGKQGVKRLARKGAQTLAKQGGRGVGVRPRGPPKGIKGIKKRKKPVKRKTDALGLF